MISPEVWDLVRSIRAERDPEVRLDGLSIFRSRIESMTTAERLRSLEALAIALLPHSVILDVDTMKRLTDAAVRRAVAGVDVLFVALKLPELYALQLALGIPWSSVGSNSERGCQLWSGSIGIGSSSKSFGVAFLGESGNKQAAVATGLFLNLFQPRLALMVGMGGGNPASVEFGDVVVGEAVLDNSLRTVQESGAKIWSKLYEPSVPIRTALLAYDPSSLDLARTAKQLYDKRVGDTDAAKPRIELPLKFDWKKYSPKLHKAVIRGADDLVEDGSLSSLPDEHARAKLTDMESAGFALACHQLEQPWMVWRGVADVGQMPRTKGYQFISTLMSVLMSLSFMSQYERDVFGAAQ